MSKFYYSKQAILIIN